MVQRRKKLDGFWAKALRAMEQGPRAKQVDGHGDHGHGLEGMKGMALGATKNPSMSMGRSPRGLTRSKQGT